MQMTWEKGQQLDDNCSYCFTSVLSLHSILSHQHTNKVICWQALDYLQEAFSLIWKFASSRFVSDTIEWREKKAKFN